MSFRVDIYNDGILLGFTYYNKANVDDFNELNVYLLFIRITYQWT